MPPDDGRDPADPDRPVAGCVDARSTKDHLLGVAQRLGVRGRSTMNKAELMEAVQRAVDRAARD